MSCEEKQWRSNEMEIGTRDLVHMVLYFELAVAFIIEHI